MTTDSTSTTPTYADQRLDRLRDLANMIIANSHAEAGDHADLETLSTWALEFATNFTGLDQHLARNRNGRLPAAWNRLASSRDGRLGTD